MKFGFLNGTVRFVFRALTYNSGQLKKHIGSLLLVFCVISYFFVLGPHMRKPFYIIPMLHRKAVGITAKGYLNIGIASRRGDLSDNVIYDLHHAVFILAADNTIQIAFGKIQTDRHAAQCLKVIIYHRRLVF